MTHSLYSGDAQLRLMSDPAMRKAPTSVRNAETLRVMIANAGTNAPTRNVADEVREAAAYATKLARDLRETAKKIDEAAELGDVLGAAFADRHERNPE